MDLETAKKHVSLADKALRELNFRKTKFARIWRGLQIACSCLLFIVVGAAVLAGDPISKKVAEITGLKILVDAKIITAESTPGWRAICLIAIAMHIGSQFCSKRADIAKESERKQNATNTKKNELIAQLNGLLISLDSGKKPDEIGQELQVLLNKFPNYFQTFKITK